jgi:fumarylacetoacetase
VNQAADNTSWVNSANEPGTDFPLENLPFGVFRDETGSEHLGLAIGDQILNLSACAAGGLLQGLPESIITQCRFAASLNNLMSQGNEPAIAVRKRTARLLSADEYRGTVEPLLIAQSHAEMVLPVQAGDYTDFYASIHHATNVGRLFRPDNPLLPNYKHIPIGYHGRASSIVVSGTPVSRPRGQMKLADSDAPIFGPSGMLDYELEAGFLVGRSVETDRPVPISQAESSIFGFCLVNDWSARDIQAWESQPLGPFLSKSFATTISPWVVMPDALEPFRVPAAERPEGDPQPLPYLSSKENQERGGIDLHLEVWLETEQMRREGAGPVRLSGGNLKELYWTPAQMLAHHASNGSNLRSGDLLASGTVSGPALDSLGCLLEITQRGAAPLLLPNGETRRFLEDGDEVILRGWCEREGYHRIGFGECRGRIMPAL